MYKKLIGIFIFLVPTILFAQEEAVTASGKTVILYPDSTWKLKVQVRSSDSTASDTVAVVPEKVKPKKAFSESATGFKGFLKHELRLPALPEQSEGVYAFRLKIDKEGYVKEILTIQHGPNGEAEKVMRNAIMKLKYTPDNSIVPPLTDGVIKITVPAEK